MSVIRSLNSFWKEKMNKNEMDEVFTVYKLIILYMLDRAEGDVTQAMLSTFLLESGYANFVSLAESYAQLEKRDLVRIRLEGDKKFLQLTDAGKEALGFFCAQLNPLIRKQVDEWLVEHGRQIREDREVTAVYERMVSGVYEVRMSVKERGVTQLEVKLSVPDAASAEAIAGKWKEKNTGIYQYLIENLF
ncbi:MAG TPA: hypothetical protein DCP64_12620 [Sarcina sp.]|nr:hypothetical protein [Sarcina sp.]